MVSQRLKNFQKLLHQIWTINYFLLCLFGLLSIQNSLWRTVQYTYSCLYSSLVKFVNLKKSSGNNLFTNQPGNWCGTVLSLLHTVHSQIFLKVCLLQYSLSNHKCTEKRRNSKLLSPHEVARYTVRLHGSGRSNPLRRLSCHAPPHVEVWG